MSKKKFKKRRRTDVNVTFDEVWTKFQAYWDILSEYPDITYEEAEKIRIAKLANSEVNHETGIAK